MPTKEDTANQATNQQVSVIIESHTMNVELHSGTELHLDVELQNEIEAHPNYKIDGNIKLPNRDVHSNTKVERQNQETRFEPRLSKYVKRHHFSA